MLHRASKQMSCLWFFSVFLLIETFFMVFFNRNFFTLFKLTRVETSSKQTRKPLIWRQNYRRLSFLCNAHALLTNPLRCPDTNRIRVDGRIRFVYATCGRRYFCIRIKKFADTKISGYVWTCLLHEMNFILLYKSKWERTILCPRQDN